MRWSRWRRCWGSEGEFGIGAHEPRRCEPGFGAFFVGEEKWMRILVVVMAVVVGVMGQCVRAAGVETSAVDGVWLLKEAQVHGRRFVDSGWDSVLTVKEGGIVCTHFEGSSASFTGRVVDVGGKTGAWDLDVFGIDMSEMWEGIKYEKSRVSGIYAVAGDEMRVCVRMGGGVGAAGGFCVGG